MLSNEHLDVVHILTPPSSHIPLVQMCLDAGAHVICEKPLTPTTNELEALIATANSKSLWLMESQNLRYNNEIVKLGKLIRSGTLGEIVDVDARYCLPITRAGKFSQAATTTTYGLPGGVVHDFLPHLVYLLLEFSGNGPVANMHAQWWNAGDNDAVPFDELDAGFFCGPTRCRLRFSGSTSPGSFKIMVRGSTSNAECDVFHGFVTDPPGSRTGQLGPVLERTLSGLQLAKSGVTTVRDRVMQHNSYHGMGKMLHAFYSALSVGDPQPISFKKMMLTSSVIDEIVASIAP